MIHIITKKPEVFNITAPTTAEVSWSQTMPESKTQSLNQSYNGTKDSSFPTAAVIVPLLVIVVICALVFLGLMLRKKRKTWMCRSFKSGKPGGDVELKSMAMQTPTRAGYSERDPDVRSNDPDSKDSQANNRFAPLLEPTRNSDA